MHITTASIGSYPRIGEEKDQQRHRRGTLHFENKEISAHAFRDVVQSVAQEVIKEQIMSGVDEVTDGLISWHDPVSHFVKNTTGIKLAGLARYFDNNFYIRAPSIVSMPKFKNPVIAPEIEYAQSQSSKPVRAVLTGPYTLARFTTSDIKTFQQLAARVEFFTELIQNELKALAKLAPRTVQIDEPALALNPADFPWVKKHLEILAASSAPNKSVLAFSFASALPLLDFLPYLAFGAFNLDITSNIPQILEKLLKKPELINIEMGILNPRSTSMESQEPLIRLIRVWKAGTGAATCVITPAGGLEFLPRGAALVKLRLLCKIKDEFLSGSAPARVHA